jgi:hypothetical protein
LIKGEIERDLEHSKGNRGGFKTQQGKQRRI